MFTNNGSEDWQTYYNQCPKNRRDIRTKTALTFLKVYDKDLWFLKLIIPDNDFSFERAKAQAKELHGVKLRFSKGALVLAYSQKTIIMMLDNLIETMQTTIGSEINVLMDWYYNLY